MKRANDRYEGNDDELIYAESIAYAEHVKAKNAAFKKMSSAEQRIEIASDVIQWLRAGRVIATSGIYLEPLERQEGAAKIDGVQCYVCALGAVFAVAVERDAVECSNVFSYREGAMRGALAPYFDFGQLRMIEAAFEEWSYEKEFGDQYEDDAERMIAIMQNIIDNDGTFVPESG
jgi:hypothetical protein